MDCPVDPLPDLLILGAAILVDIWSSWKRPSRGQVLWADQLRRQFPRLGWVPQAYMLILFGWMALFIAGFVFIMNRSFRHPGIIAGGGIALLGVAQGLLGTRTGVYLLDSRWSRLYVLGEEARRRGLIQVLLNLAVLLMAGLLGIWLK